jgi:two-component system nitrogen regulation sensor histidine kinase GlnL
MSGSSTKLAEAPCGIAVQSATGLALLDEAGRFCWLNPAWAETLELSPRRLLGESLGALDPTQPALIEAMQKAQAESASVHVRHLRLAPPLGREVLADITVTALPDGGVLLELHELSVDAESGEAERGTPRLSESLRGFAHEVKNPLAGLRGAAQLLRRRVGDGDLVELAELVIAEADRLTALADRLLHASAKPHLALLNIHEPIERVLAVLAAEEGALRLQRDFDPSLPPLRGDADRLTQLLLNLARNASEAGARSLALRTRVERGAHLAERIVRTALRVT